MNVKKRKCIGCYNTFDRSEMFRIMKKFDNGEIIVNPTNKDFGRSVYICKNKECIEKAFKKNKINHFLKIKSDNNLKSTLEKALAK